MHAMTMEGLVGARMNVNLIDTPMRVYNEAKRKGDTAKMERAMGYVNEFQNKAEEYQVKADKGMEEDAKEAKEKAELEREKVIKKRREECEKFENTDSDSSTASETADASKLEPVIYTKTGETDKNQSESSVSISVSI